ncbi:MAG: 4Fe-4S binding protein [Planctomycetia bacterium]|nr:4Fe-4S binding protein [Planctomycetia bacterium]
MLRKLRITGACIVFALLTFLFCDFTGTFIGTLAPLAEIQFLPAFLAGNAIIIAALLITTFLFGRLYCSIICPFGVFQDVISRLAIWRKKNRFGWQQGKTFWRVGFLTLFVVLFLCGFSSVAALLDPYSAFGRITSNLFAPIYRLGNNLLAYWAERSGSYAFYSVDVWMKGIETFIIAIATLMVAIIFAVRWGRLYCNTVCPVGAILGLIAKYAILKPRIETSKCNGCGLCAKNCKASCINPEKHVVDSSRCIVCFNCIEKCPQKAISYRKSFESQPAPAPVQGTLSTIVSSTAGPASTASPIKATETLASPMIRRGFLSMIAFYALTKTGLAQEKPKKKKKEFDGGLAPLVKRVPPTRTVAPLPPGSQSLRNFARRCSACQLCVSVCPNQVLRPSQDSWKTTMQPSMSFERGYCRPECVRCSEVCPTGAILPTTTADKSATQIGYAVWVRDACIVITDDVECGNCERHCPTDAIEMIPLNPDDPQSKKIPTVNVERCIGCGACENLCPARPTSAIYVEGVDRQRTI